MDILLKMGLLSKYVFIFLLNTLVLTTKSLELNETKPTLSINNDGDYSNRKYLTKNVWIYSDYNSNNPPKNIHGKTNVDVDWYEVPKVLSIDEKENKVTLQLKQYLEWEDPRIVVNYSAISTMIKPNSYMKIPPNMVKELWHPNLDMYTNNLLEWKSIFDPFWFQSFGINKCPWTRDCDLSPDVPLVYALKIWRVSLYCKFDFLKFPLDKHLCKFKQAFGSTSDTVGIYYYPTTFSSYQNNRSKTIGNWTFSAAGFEVTIEPTGTKIKHDTLDQINKGNFGFEIKLERIIQPYLLQYYIPCITIVLVSMISFLIPLTAIPGRVALVVTLFLTLTNIFTAEMVRHLDT